MVAGLAVVGVVFGVTGCAFGEPAPTYDEMTVETFAEMQKVVDQFPDGSVVEDRTGYTGNPHGCDDDDLAAYTFTWWVIPPEGTDIPKLIDSFPTVLGDDYQDEPLHPAIRRYGATAQFWTPGDRDERILMYVAERPDRVTVWAYSRCSLPLPPPSWEQVETDAETEAARAIEQFPIGTTTRKDPDLEPEACLPDDTGRYQGQWTLTTPEGTDIPTLLADFPTNLGPDYTNLNLGNETTPTAEYQAPDDSLVTIVTITEPEPDTHPGTVTITISTACAQLPDWATPTPTPRAAPNGDRGSTGHPDS